MEYRRLWIGLAVVILGSFAILGGYGWDLYRKAPPVPERVRTTGGRLLFTGQEIRDGQNVWQSLGGQEMGSVWGHGSYVAPDWSADWLHRESEQILDTWARAEHQHPYRELNLETQAGLQALELRGIGIRIAREAIGRGEGAVGGPAARNPADAAPDCTPAAAAPEAQAASILSASMSATISGIVSDTRGSTGSLL